VFKALTAVALARKLKARGLPAAPVFWLATEDHDLAEVDHAWVFDHKATPKRIDAASVATGGPVGSVAVGELDFASIRAALGQLPEADAVMELLREAYAPGATFGAAFHNLLKRVLGPMGLVFLDPLAPAIREISAEFMEEVVERLPELLRKVRERDRELIARGYHAQVHIEEDSSLLFRIRDGKRMALRWKDGQFQSKNGGPAGVAVKEAPETLSPNALLRPVMQDYLLPTVSYVGGPAEIAYMAQAGVLYEELLGRMPVVFPRNSFTLLDARASKTLARYRLNLEQVFDYPDKVKSRMAATLVPEGIDEDFASARGLVSSSMRKLRLDLVGFDPTLASAAEKSWAKMLYQLDKLAEKSAREAMRREERAGDDAAYLLNLLYPQRHPQERFYSIVPFLAKHGLDLPERLLDLVNLDCPDHMVATL
jgi:bacillithiol biosynthesis cysteine-adding enzyme BshC